MSTYWPGNTVSTASSREQDGSGNPIGSIVDGNGVFNSLCATGPTNFIYSTVNTTSVQLAASASFTGAVESASSQVAASILLTSDQNGTFTVYQYFDAAGLTLASTIIYNIQANAPFCQSIILNGNFIKTKFTNNGAVATTSFQLNVAYGTIQPANNAGVPIFQVVSGTNGGATPLWIQNLGAKTQIKSTAGTIYYIMVSTGTAAAWVQFFNATSANITLGTTAPFWEFYVPASTSLPLPIPDVGIAFTNALTVASTTLENGTVVSTTNVIANVAYI